MIEKEIEEDEQILEYVVDTEMTGLIELFSVQSPSRDEGDMQQYIWEYLLELPFIDDLEIDIDDTGNIMVTRGHLQGDEFYPCVIAHMDGVHDRENGYKINSRLNEAGDTELYATCDSRKVKSYLGTAVSIEPSDLAGIAGDDKCGIWMALECLKSFDVIKAVFTIGEEVGKKK